MPNRILREGILTSERVAMLGWAEEVFYRRLMSVVDDFGRFTANPKLIRAACYPLLVDKVSDADVGKWLAKCAEAALVSVYPAPDGKRYLQLHDFKQQTRAEKSKYPEMPSRCIADATQPPSNGTASAHVYVFGDGDVIGDVGSGPSQAPEPPPAYLGDANAGEIPGKAVVLLAAGWELPEAWGTDAEALGWKASEILHEAEKFRQYWVAGKGAGGRKSLRGWRQAWSNWLDKAAKFAGPRRAA